MKSALSLIFGFVLLIVVAAAVAAENTKVHVEYSLSRFGSSVCKDAKIVLAEEEVLLCEGVNSKNNHRVLLKATIKKTEDNQYKIQTQIEEINLDNVIKVVGQPSITTIPNESAEVSTSNGAVTEFSEKEELMKLSVTVNAVM